MWCGKAERPYVGWLRFACCALLLAAQPAGAQPRADVAIMKRAHGDVPAELAERIDRALLRALAEVAGITEPTLSNVGYGEVQLAVGCSDDSPQCLMRIARVAEVDALVVRALSLDASGLLVLQLLYFDEASPQAPVQLQMATTRDRAFEIESAMPRIVRRLLGIDVPAPAPAQPPVEAASAAAVAGPSTEAVDGGGAVSPLTWAALAIGAGGIGAGIALWASADADYDALTRMRVRTQADAERVHRDFEAIEARASLANVLAPAGAVALGIGVALLVNDLQGAGSEQARASVQVVPLGGGGMLGVRGTFWGAR